MVGRKGSLFSLHNFTGFLYAAAIALVDMVQRKMSVPLVSFLIFLTDHRMFFQNENIKNLLYQVSLFPCFSV